MVYPNAWKCPNCKRVVKDNKTCPECKFKFSAHFPDLWTCPKCGRLVNESRVCDKCNYPEDLHYPESWHCSNCGELVKSRKKCSECGYEPKVFEKTSASPSLQKRISLPDVLSKRKDVLLASVGLITLLGVLLLISIPSPVSSLESEILTAGDSVSFAFTTTITADSVFFEFSSPSGKVYEYSSVSAGEGNWVVPGLVLNESGEWSVVTSINSFGAVTEVIDSILVEPVCNKSSDCSSGVCCFGACAGVCGSDADCSDGLSYTIDTCVVPNTCSAECVHEEVWCSIFSDGYCPTDCNLETDADCSNCPLGEVMCAGSCHETCFSDADCSDGNSSTSDECVVSTNPCDSYCDYTPYSEIPCPVGKIRVGTKCVTPVCFTHDDCDDGRTNTAHKCYYPGTQQSYCYHQECLAHQVVCKINGTNACVTPACSSNSDCDKGAPDTTYYCMNYKSCDAYCIACENNLCSDHLVYTVDCNDDNNGDGLDDRFSIEGDVDDVDIVDNDVQYVNTNTKDSGVYINYYRTDEVMMCRGDNYNLHNGSEYVIKFELTVEEGVVLVISGMSSPGDPDYLTFEEGYSEEYELTGTVNCERNYKVIAFYANYNERTKFYLDYVDLRINYKD